MKNTVKKFEKYVYMHASPKYLYTSYTNTTYEHLFAKFKTNK